MDWIEQLRTTHDLSDAQFAQIIETDDFDTVLMRHADEVRREVYGDKVYVRGLIEFTNYCKNNCYYCGIRCAHRAVERYRLSKDEVLACCDAGYALGYRTFVLQGGEDPYFTDDCVCDLVASIRRRFPDCAITLSIGEKSDESYRAYYEAGANRYLLRHETADVTHYGLLHPGAMSLDHRKQCLFALKQIGYQVGAGFMVGSPFQTTKTLLADLRFLQQLAPDMIGIGPFIPSHDTPFSTHNAGSVALTVRLLAMLRLMFPYVLLPATTALATLSPNGRELGLRAGANVVMPNLSPTQNRNKYALYDHKAATDEEAAEGRKRLEEYVARAGYRVVTDVGNVMPHA